MKRRNCLKYVLLHTLLVMPMNMNAQQIDKSFQMHLSLGSPKAPAAEPSIIIVTIENSGKQAIRVLDVMESQKVPFQVFFAFQARKIGGEPVVGIRTAGKADFFGPGLKYKDLKPGEKFDTHIPLSQILPQDTSPGEYELSVSYHNQYGDDCVKGFSFPSEPIRVRWKQP